MICVRCGSPVGAGAARCPSCALPVAAPAKVTARSRAPEDDAETEPTERVRDEDLIAVASIDREATRQVSDEELAAALGGADREATRQVGDDELLRLRADSTGATQKLTLEDLIPVEEGAPSQDDPEFLQEPKLTPAPTAAPEAPRERPPSRPRVRVATPQGHAVVAPVVPVKPPASAEIMAALKRGNGSVHLGDHSALARLPRALTPSQPTLRIAPAPPAALRRNHVLTITCALVAATLLSVVGLSWRESMRSRAQRAEKEHALAQARARSDAAPPAPPAAPTPSRPFAQPAGDDPGCLLGSRRGRVEGRDFCIDVYEYPGGHSVPRTGISFADAERTCALRGARLCTHKEWLIGCAGSDGAPIGPDEPRCNLGAALAQAGAAPRCKSALGLYDMIGNAAEWVADRVVVGAALDGGKASCRSSASVPETGHPRVGFRCCRDSNP
jgi:hypothetical protein